MAIANMAAHRMSIVVVASMAVHAAIVSIPMLQRATGDAAPASVALDVTLVAENSPKTLAVTPTHTTSRSRHVAPNLSSDADRELSVAAPSLGSNPVAEAPVPIASEVRMTSEDYDATNVRAPAETIDISAQATHTTAIMNQSIHPTSATPTAAHPDTGVVLTQIRDEIERDKVYPDIARRRGWEGEVHLGFRVEGSGMIDDIRVLRSSGNSILDESAMRALRRVHHVPAELWIDGYTTDLELPVIYRLREG